MDELPDIGDVVDVATGFLEVESSWCPPVGMVCLLDRRTAFRRDPACSDEETACLDMPDRLSSCGSTGSVSCVLGHPCTSFDVVYVVSDLARASWPRNVACFDIWSVVVEASDAVVVDDEAVEW